MGCLWFERQRHHLWILDPIHCPVNVMLDLLGMLVSSGDNYFCRYFSPVHKSDHHYYCYYFNESSGERKYFLHMWTENTHACLKGQHNGNAFWPVEHHCCCSWMWSRLPCWWWLTICIINYTILLRGDHLYIMCKTCFLERTEDCLNSFTSHSLYLVFSL